MEDEILVYLNSFLKIHGFAHDTFENFMSESGKQVSQSG